MIHAVVGSSPSRRALAVLLGGAAMLASGIAGAQEGMVNRIALNAAAPEFVGGPWLNTRNGAPIRLASRRGKVTVVEFWTFGCINCKRNLPIYARWQKRFEKQGVVIVGVHTPETESEKVPANVARRVGELGITYPVLLDANEENWNRWGQQFWPTVYLVDKRGRVRYRWEGELEYGRAGGEAKTAQRIGDLLRESD